MCQRVAFRGERTQENVWCQNRKIFEMKNSWVVTNTTTIYMFVLCVKCTLGQLRLCFASGCISFVVVCFLLLNFLFINGSFASCATYYRLYPTVDQSLVYCFIVCFVFLSALGWDISLCFVGVSCINIAISSYYSYDFPLLPV